MGDVFGSEDVGATLPTTTPTRPRRLAAAEKKIKKIENASPARRPAGPKSEAPPTASPPSLFASSKSSQHERDDDAMIAAEDVRTGEDATRYFYARRRDATGREVKFFHCVRAAPGRSHHKPYDLLVVSRQECAKHESYYTFSASGVTRVCVRSGEASEHIDLARWAREKSAFDALTRLPFFKHHRVRKAFDFWRSNVRKASFERTKRALMKRLFHANDTFVPALMDVCAIASEIKTVAVVRCAPGATTRLKDFADAAAAQRRETAKPAFEALFKRATRAVERVCSDVAAHAAKCRDEVKDVATLNDVTGVDNVPGRAPDKTQSMTAIKARKITRARTYRRVNDEEKRLGDFVRLVDHVLTQALVERATTTTEEVLSLLAAGRPVAGGGRGGAAVSASSASASASASASSSSSSSSSFQAASKGVFTTTIKFTPTSIAFHPPREDVARVIRDDIVAGVVRTVNAAPRILRARAFVGLFPSLFPPGVDPRDVSVGLEPAAIVRDSARFRGAVRAIDATIGDDFDAAEAYATQARSVCSFTLVPIRLRSLRWTPPPGGRFSSCTPRFRSRRARRDGCL